LCANIGLQPIEMMSYAQAENIIHYLNDIKVNFVDGHIPFGYDYGCKAKKLCTHSF